MTKTKQEAGEEKKIGKLQKEECDSILKFLFSEEEDKKDLEEYIGKYFDSEEKWRLVFECVQDIDIKSGLENYMEELSTNIKEFLPNVKMIITLYDKSGKNRVFSGESESRTDFMIGSIFPNFDMHKIHTELSRFFNKINHKPRYQILPVKENAKGNGEETGYIYLEFSENYDKEDDIYFKSLVDKIVSQIEVINLYDEIKKEGEKKAEFAASISHEIKTPLNGVISYCELLRKNSSALGTELKNYVENLCITSHQLKCLLMDVIESAKLKCGKIIIRKQSFETKKAIENVLKIFTNSIIEKNLDIKSILMQVSIISDYTKFNQILYNLISNAVKFSGQKTSIGIMSWIQEGKYWFEIKNTGMGISKKQAERIFEFLSTTNPDAIKNPEGSGIGLCVSKQLIEAMNGKLEFESTNEETVFRFYLPA